MFAERTMYCTTAARCTGEGTILGEVFQPTVRYSEADIFNVIRWVAEAMRPFALSTAATCFSDFDRSDRLRLVVGGRIITAASATRVDCYCARVEINTGCIEPARACAWSRVSVQPSVGRRHDRRYYWTADPSETTPLLCTARPVDQFRVCLSVAYVATVAGRNLS